ncbi:MAG: TonB-dependent receptor [Bacillota bacterium]
MKAFFFCVLFIALGFNAFLGKNLASGKNLAPFENMASGVIKGKVIEKSTMQPLPGANVVIPGTSMGAAADENGEYKIENVPAGRYSLQASMTGYLTAVETEVVVNNVRPAEVDFVLSESTVTLNTVTVQSDYFRKDPASVNSTANFSYEEIRRAPGGFEDVVRALSTLPGIAQADAGRNDLIVRGGAPSENLYTVDEIVIPNINHFGTQGSSGGPLSYIDLNYVKDVNLSTGGFAAGYGDKLSSVMNIKLGEGRKDRLGGKATISATQFGINADGPLNSKTNFLFSLRRSYLDLIFKAAGFGFVPEYYDMLNKVTYNADQHNSLSFLLIGALDNVRYFNNTPDQRYSNSKTLGNDQLQYISALSYRHLFSNGFINFSLNRNYTRFDISQKDTLGNIIFLNNSKESENNIKADLVIKPTQSSELSAGMLARFIRFNSDVRLPFFKTSFGDILEVNSLNKGENFKKVGSFLQYSSRLSAFLGFNAGLRLDYFDAIDNPLTVSPRLSVSFFPDELTSLNLSAGTYYQTPSYIWLMGDKRNSALKSIKSNHFILGLERRLREDTQLRLEGFYKIYDDYPVSTLRPYLILSNTGAGFGGSEDNFSAFALEHLTNQGKGNVRGVELLIQKKSSKIPYYGIASITYSKSVFTALDGIKRPGSFDQRIILNISGGYIFNDKWEAALKFRYASGRPFTPFNPDGTQSPSLYNSGRLSALHSLDIRVDRRWNFDNWALIAYVDVQNIYNRKNISSVTWDERKNAVKEPSSIGILPSIGFSAEF